MKSTSTFSSFSSENIWRMLNEREDMPRPPHILHKKILMISRSTSKNPHMLQLCPPDAIISDLEALALINAGRPIKFIDMEDMLAQVYGQRRDIYQEKGEQSNYMFFKTPHQQSSPRSINTGQETESKSVLYISPRSRHLLPRYQRGHAKQRIRTSKVFFVNLRCMDAMTFEHRYRSRALDRSLKGGSTYKTEASVATMNTGPHSP